MTKSKRFAVWHMCLAAMLSLVGFYAHASNTMFGYSVTGDNKGIVSFNDISFYPILEYPLSAAASCAAYGEGGYYVYSSGKLSCYNVSTGVIKKEVNMVANLADMAFSWKDGVMYGLAKSGSYDSELISINLGTGETYKVCSYSTDYRAIAINNNGQIFMVDSYGYLETCTTQKPSQVTRIGDTGLVYYTDYATMDYNIVTDKLYACYTRNGYSYMAEIDTSSARATQVGSYNSDYTIVGLYTGYKYAPANTPAAVSNLTATPASGGDTSCTLSWTNPSINNAESELSNITKVTVYRDDALVATLTDCVVGGEATYTDDKASEGSHRYKVVAHNSVGEGVASYINAFVGIDTPAAPNNLSIAKASDNAITLTWDAPTTGANNGWFNSAELTYKVVRINDDATVAQGLTQCTFTDNVSAYGSYSYKVYAITMAGESPAATSESIIAGAAIALPYTGSFENKSDYDAWSTYDLDPNANCWQYGQYSNFGYGAFALCGTNEENNNWLVSPPISFSAGAIPQLILKYYTSYYNTENIEIAIGTDPNPANLTVFSQQALKNYYGKTLEVEAPAITEDGTYYIGIRHCTEKSKGMVIMLKDFTIKSLSDGSVTGTVTSSGAPLAGATISINGLSATTDGNGSYTLEAVKAGTHTITATKPGYYKDETTVEVVAGKTATVDFTLYALTTHKVTGKVIDAAGNAIVGARIHLYNADHSYDYSAETDAKGEYTFGAAYPDSYKLEVAKNLYTDVTYDVVIDSDKTLATTVMSAKGIAPLSVEASEMNKTVTVSWKAPADIKLFSYDSGTPVSAMGYDSKYEESVVGTVYRTPAVVHEVMWYSPAQDGKAESVVVFLIDLDENGEPNGNVLHKSEHIPAVDDQWATYKLPEPVNAPNGFVVALTGPGNVCLAYDEGEDGDVVKYPHTQCYSTLYSSAVSYRYLDETSRKSRRFLLRANCEMYESNGSIKDIKYNVYRLQSNKKNDESAWTSIATQTAEYSVTDTQVARGEYVYAVKAFYPADGTTSGATFSNALTSDMHSQVKVTVTTNTEDSHANGATVTLTNEYYNYSASVVNNVATFDYIAKDTYKVTIVKDGFETLVVENVSTDTDETVVNLSYKLTQALQSAANIDIINSNGNDWTLVWNAQPNLVDDFDGDDHPSFTMQSPGNIGWQYLDNDHWGTYGFASYEFPNMRESMAAIVMDEIGMTPEYQGRGIALSGTKCLAFIAAFESSGSGDEVILNKSDDYLFSPELNFYTDFKFKFWARSYEEFEGKLETFRVGYSTTDINPNSFKWFSDTLTIAPINYVQFSYDIPKEAKYIALNNQSNSVFMLTVDDVFVGTETQVAGSGKLPVNLLKSKVYLDGVLTTETTNNQYTFANLTEGSHTAEVVEVYATGESKPLSISFTVGNSGINNTIASDIVVYTHNNTLWIKGDYTMANIYAVNGSYALSACGKQTVDLSALTPGIYIVKVVAANGAVHTSKVVVK